MANTFLTPSIIARRALATLYNTTVLAPLMWRDYDGDFQGKQGNAVTVRTPAVFTAQEYVRADGIQVQNITEGSETVTLDHFPDVSIAVTTEELTLHIDDFAERVLNPAMEAMVQKLDGDLAEALVDAAEGGSGGGTMTASGATAKNVAFRNARAKLTRNKLAFSERYGVLSPEAAAQALGDELFVRVDASGATDALREGNVGRVFGFDTYESQVFGWGPGDRGQADGVAFHRHAVALVTRVPALPMGKTSEQAATVNYKGLGLRVVKSYDIDKKQDVISIDTLYGIKSLRPGGVVQIDFGLGS